MPRPTTGRPNGRPPKATASAQGELHSGISEIPEFPLGELPETQRTFWNFLWEQGAKWLTPADAYAITLLCELKEEKEWLHTEITLKGKRLQVNKNGTVSPHNYVTQLKDVRAQINTLMGALGFTPADRARIAVQQTEGQEALKALLERGNKGVEA